jgi:hypothetical protein
MPFPAAKYRLSWVAGIKSLRVVPKSSDITSPIAFTVTTCVNGDLGRTDRGSGNVEVSGCQREARTTSIQGRPFPMMTSSKTNTLPQDVDDFDTDDENLEGPA